MDGNNRRLLFNSDRSGLISGIFNLDGYAGEYFSTRSTIPPYLYGQYDICIDDMGNTHQHTHDELHKHRKEHYDDHAGIHSREMWEDMI